MIKIVMGLKGTGKTKMLIQEVNAAVAKDHGSVVCIEKEPKLTYDISHKARLISASEYDINTFDRFFGFLSGLMAANYDITDIYVDSIFKICGDDMAKFEEFLTEVEKILKNVNVFITVSGDEKTATQAIRNYF